MYIYYSIECQYIHSNVTHRAFKENRPFGICKSEHRVIGNILQNNSLTSGSIHGNCSSDDAITQTDKYGLPVSVSAAQPL